jgi:serine phosphatase RsbU (regulator of sigma subunit)
VNRRILQDTSADQFVTVFYGILDPVTGMLVYSSAGHCPALHFCKDDKDVRALARTGIPLGIFKDQSWGQETVQLDPGDLFLLYTDGITEAHIDPTFLFDQEGLVESVRATLATAGSQPPSAQKVQEGILADVCSFLGSTPQPDDIALTILLRNQ